MDHHGHFSLICLHNFSLLNLLMGTYLCTYVNLVQLVTMSMMGHTKLGVENDRSKND